MKWLQKHPFPEYEVLKEVYASGNATGAFVKSAIIHVAESEEEDDYSEDEEHDKDQDQSSPMSHPLDAEMAAVEAGKGKGKVSGKEKGKRNEAGKEKVRDATPAVIKKRKAPSALPIVRFES